MLFSPAQRTSWPHSSGHTRPRSFCFAKIAAGRHPGTLDIRPFSESSPSVTRRSRSSWFKIPIDVKSARAIGRSKWLPSFKTSAGERFTMMCLAGSESPIEKRLAFILSFDSATALSGSPTIEKDGSPFII